MTAPEFDPTAGLFLPPPPGPAVGLRYRSGRLTAWDITTGENTVQIDGESFDDLPILPGSFLSIMQVGDTVALLSTSDSRGVSTYAIMGVSIVPPDWRLAVASRRAGFAKYVSGIGTINTSVTSASYVPVGSMPETKMFKVSTVSRVELEMTGTAYTDNAAAGVQYAIRVDGVTDYPICSLFANNTMLFAHTTWAGGNLITLSGTGDHTFQPVWARTGGAGTVLMDPTDQITMTVREIL